MQHGCENEFLEADVRAFGSEALFKKYVRFRLQIDVDLDPNLRWCPRNGENEALFAQKQLANAAKKSA